MLDGRRFDIFTDHQPRTYAMARVSEPLDSTPNQAVVLRGGVYL